MRTFLLYSLSKLQLCNTGLSTMGCFFLDLEDGYISEKTGEFLNFSESLFVDQRITLGIKSAFKC